jgi:hypothetical protein
MGAFFFLASGLHQLISKASVVFTWALTAYYSCASGMVIVLNRVLRDKSILLNLSCLMGGQ